MMSRILRFGLFASMLGLAACDQNPLTRNALLLLTVNMPTTEEASYADGVTVEGELVPGATVTPTYGMIVVKAGTETSPPPWIMNPKSYQFSSSEGVFKIPLQDDGPNPQTLSLLADDGFERKIWVLVRVCRNETDCSGAATTGPTRDHIWVIERGLYKTKTTNITLPINDATDPRTPVPYGCIEDEWRARAEILEPSPMANTVELSRCFVFGCAMAGGDVIWGCPGASYDNMCELSPGAPTHNCDGAD